MTDHRRRARKDIRARHRRLPPPEHLIGLPTAGELAPRLTQTLIDLLQPLLGRALTHPRVDRALEELLARPRRLQVAGALIGLVLIALSVYPLLVSSARPARPALRASNQQAAAPAVATGDAVVEQEVLGVVAAYNQASIAAAVLNRPAAMAPYLAPEGAAWAAIQAEYARRDQRGETHDPALTRWGVLRVDVAGDTATVETQEQWDDRTSVGGAVVRSQRGILTRNSYTLRRSPSPGGRWLIVTVESTTVVN